jgi:hypothetical protein
VASFARRVTRGRWRVAVRGELRASDLRRLERACAPALEQFPVPLDLEVDTLHAVDEPARRFVVCLLYRGATLVGASRARWEAVIGTPGAGSFTRGAG